MRVLAILFLAATAHSAGERGADIKLRDLPGTNGEWQEGTALIPAPRAQVHFWLTDYKNWPKRFPDVGFVMTMGQDSNGWNVVRFSSRIVDAIITVHEQVQPHLLVFWGSAPYTHTQGRIYLVDLGDGTTRVHMQSTADVHGFYKIFATKGLKRERAYRVTRSHLQALYDLATKGDRVLDLTRKP
jgi:hypothetical protein